MTTAEVDGRLRQVLRRAEIAGHHGEAPSQVVARPDCRGCGDRALRVADLVDEYGGRGQRDALVLGRRGCLEVTELPGPEDQTDAGLLDLLRRRGARVPAQRTHAHGLCPTTRECGGAPDGSCAIGDLAESNQQHASGPARASFEVEQFISGATKVAALEGAG